MAEKHYVGESGTEIRIDGKRDLTNAVNMKVFMRRPDSSIIEFIPTVIESNYLRFFTDANSFNTPGHYEVQPYIELDGWAGRGKTAAFIVYDEYA